MHQRKPSSHTTPKTSSKITSENSPHLITPQAKLPAHEQKLSPSMVLYLQRTIGNHKTRQMIHQLNTPAKPIQRVMNLEAFGEVLKIENEKKKKAAFITMIVEEIQRIINMPKDPYQPINKGTKTQTSTSSSNNNKSSNNDNLFSSSNKQNKKWQGPKNKKENQVFANNNNSPEKETESDIKSGKEKEENQVFANNNNSPEKETESDIKSGKEKEETPVEEKTNTLVNRFEHDLYNKKDCSYLLNLIDEILDINPLKDKYFEIRNLLVQFEDSYHGYSDPKNSNLHAIEGVTIGNEFTFTNAILAETIKKEDVYKAMSSKYEQIRKLWLEKMNQKKETLKNLGLDFISKDEKQFASKTDQMRKQTYIFHRIDPQSKKETEIWRYEFTADQAVVEIITSPVVASEIYKGDIGVFMDEFIFDIAKQCGLMPHVLDDGILIEGGGHVNIGESFFDSKSKNNISPAKLLKEFMKKFYADYEFWATRDEDSKNSPFLREYSTPKDEKTKKKEKEKKAESIAERFSNIEFSDKESVESLADKLINKVFTESLVEDNTKGKAHYQALNVEHLATKEHKESRRLEVRRIRAQANRQELIQQLMRLAELLADAKTPNSKEENSNNNQKNKNN
jgi:hypothetical protein